MKKMIVALLAAAVFAAAGQSASAWGNGNPLGRPATEPLWGLWRTGPLPKPEPLGGIISGAGALPEGKDARELREQGPLFPFATPPRVNLTAREPINLQ